jgi:hypothetical protein
LEGVRRALSKEPVFEPQRDVDQADQDWDLDERPDDGSKRLAGADPEDSYCHGDGQLEIVAGSGEGNARCSGIISAYLLAHIERDQEHDYKIDEQWNGDAHHVQRNLHDELTFEGEHHHDGEQ